MPRLPARRHKTWGGRATGPLSPAEHVVRCIAQTPVCAISRPPRARSRRAGPRCRRAARRSPAGPAAESRGSWGFGSGRSSSIGMAVSWRSGMISGLRPLTRLGPKVHIPALKRIQQLRPAPCPSGARTGRHDPPVDAEGHRGVADREEPPLTFTQIADFCGMHPLEVQAIADGEVAQGIVGYDPGGPTSRSRQTRSAAARPTRMRG